MKNLFAFLVALFAVNGASAQWFPVNSGATTTLNSVCFTDANTGYSVGDAGTILKTINGGITWMPLSSGTSLKLLSVLSPEVLTGYILCESDTLLKTTDGGVNWLELPFCTSRPIHSVWFTDALTGFAVGDSGTILKTTDGGTNWIPQYSGTNYYLRSVHFPGVNLGYVVGDFGTILKTTDGGASWVLQNPGTVISLTSGFFPDENTGYVLGGYWEIATPAPVWHQLIYKTTDGGTTWSWVRAWSNCVCNSIYFTDANNGYLCGRGFYEGALIFHTNNGGFDWEEQYFDSVSSLNSICFPRFDTGYAVGEGYSSVNYYGAILKTTNGGTVGINSFSGQQKLLTIYPNPASVAITIECSSTGFLSIRNLNGQQIMQQKITGLNTTIDVSTLPGGVYFARVTGGQMVQVGKIIKK